MKSMAARRKKTRTYTKAARALSEAETRDRIIEAMVELHQELGPRRTTVMAIAERAGVQRLTVYRHFPDEPSMFAACSGLWNERNPPPQASGSPREVLTALYRYYRRVEPMLTKVLADMPYMPVVADQMAPFIDFIEQLVAEMERTWRGRSSKRRATLQHAVQFETWRSLAALTNGDGEAAELVLRWCDASSVP
jgi:AcrR family transcriptional regulator